MNNMYKETVKSRSVAWLAALMAILMIACSDTQQVEQELLLGTPVTAHFCLSAANSGITTRAGEVEENMKSWVVIITNKSNGTVENVFTKDNVGNLTEDVVANFTTQVTTGTKRIYSFANITLEELIKAINPEIGTIGDPIATIKSIANIEAAIRTATFLPQGNNWADAENKGIPMSNWQDLEIKSDGKTYTLYVCRMIAKVEFRLENKTGQPVTVKNVTISDITSNESPVMLMPKTSVTAERDIKQSVNLPMASDGAFVSVETTEVKALKEDGTDAITLSADATTPTSVTVYVNESQVQSDYGLFRLTLTIDRGTGEEEELRYALLSDESSNWTWIARNDHRIIPITIDDYKLDLVPVDFPPIGVYPASVKEDEEGSFTCTFYAGGNFHLAPVVTRYSTGESLLYGWGGNEAGTWIIKSFTEDNTTAIYTTDTPLNWNGKDPMLTGAFNNGVTGEAYHELTVTVNKGNGVTQTLLGRIWVKLAGGSN